MLTVPFAEAWHYYLMALMYIMAGTLHLIKPSLYIPILPDKFPAKLFTVHLSGIAEILLGTLLCIPACKPAAIAGVILMLLAFLPVHIHMLRDKKFHSRFPLWALWLRIPLQFLLMFWAYSYL